jgi:hypothetical protein
VRRQTVREQKTTATLQDSQPRRGISRHQRIIVREQTTIAMLRASRLPRGIVRAPITIAMRDSRITDRELTTIAMFRGRVLPRTIVRQRPRTTVLERTTIATQDSRIIGPRLR